MAMDVCYPPGTDWSSAYPTTEAYEAARAVVGAEQKFALAEMFAWSMLAALTNYRIGTCPVTVRPCAASCAPEGSYRVARVGGGYTGALGAVTIGRFSPFMSGGVWFNACGCSNGCECSNLPEVILPGPVGKIVEIHQDGEILPRSAYKVLNGGRLVRTDGEPWPACQDLALSDDDGFSVTYYRGAAPNAMILYTAGILANEYLLGFNGDEACRLSSNLTAMTRSGESYEFENKDYPGGIPEVDNLVRIYNPNGIKSPIIVASPDSYETAVPTWQRR